MIVENNYLDANEAISFDKELATCIDKGSCDTVIDKYRKLSSENTEKLKVICQENPLVCEGYYKEVIEGGIETTERPWWLYKSMSADEAKVYVRLVNEQDLLMIDTTSESWMKFAVFVSNPENQAAVTGLVFLSKDLLVLAKNTFTNLTQSRNLTGIKSLQTGLRNPQQVDAIKNDMVSGNYRFTAPEGRIAGYVDSKGNYYISEGNHRMVAAQEIYKKTGDHSYIDKLLQNGLWTQTKNAPVGAKPMPVRK